MKAKELAEILLTKPESDVCIKRGYVINPHGDIDYCTKGIESIGIEDGKFVLYEKLKRMEEVKYIQGDLVKLNGKTVKITFAGHDVIEYIPLDRRGGDEWRTSRKLIEPIKLTPQILEDNGWVKGELKKEDNARAYYYTYSKKGCIVELRYYTLCDMFLVYIDQEALMNILFLYVHQIQHLLFGLGLSSNLKV